MVCGLGMHFHLRATEVDIVWLPARFMGILLTLGKNKFNGCFVRGGACMFAFVRHRVGVWVLGFVRMWRWLPCCFLLFVFSDFYFVMSFLFLWHGQDVCRFVHCVVCTVHVLVFAKTVSRILESCWGSTRLRVRLHR